ncbi:FAD-dependent oxidoreductase [Trichothermofontia sp.]
MLADWESPRPVGRGGCQYDLVIIGGSLAGRYAAAAAATLHARVALVEPCPAEEDPYFLSQVWLQAWQQVGQIQEHRYQADLLGFPAPDLDLDPWTTLNWSQTIAWSEAIAAQTIAPLSRDRLAQLGIDVVPEAGQFQRRPYLGFLTATRSLTARAYLLAPASQAIVPAIAGLQSVGYLTPATLGYRVAQLPRRVAIVGNHSSGVVLAQALNRLGVVVTLVTEDPYLLIQCDPDIALLIQAQLEAEGVQVFTQTAVTQVRQVAAQIQVQLGQPLGQGEMAVEAIIVAAGWQLDGREFNLESLGLKQEHGRWRLNRYLQTPHRRIYCCNQTDSPEAIRQHVRVALRNALFWPLSAPPAPGAPQIILTQPEVASIGLLAAQAYRRYGKDQVWVLQQSCATIAAAQVQASTSGFCKLVVHRNGRLLGAHLVGPGASSLIAPITLALHHGLKVSALIQATPALPAEVTVPSGAMAAIVSQTAAQWPAVRLQHSPFWQNVLESLFGWRRR